MIVFLYGPDGFRLKENVNVIINSYRKKHKKGMNHYYFDLADTSFTNRTCQGIDGLVNAIKNVSFFDETKLIIIKNLFYSGQTIISQLTVLVDDFKITDDKKTVLVFLENKAQKELEKVNKELLIFLSSKQNLVRNIEYLEGARLSHWVNSEFKKCGHDVSTFVVDLLTNLVGNESWALANEVNKLSNYLTGKTCYNRSCLLTKEDISLLVGRKEDTTIFDLVDAVGSQNRARAFETMYCLIHSGRDIYYLLNMLTYHFENLLSVSDLTSRSLASGGEMPTVPVIARKCNIHPFVARKIVSQVRKFPEGLLLEKFNQLAGLDISSKNGLTNLEDSLYNFVVS